MRTSRLQERLAAIAEPTRFQIVELLRAHPRAVGDLVAELDVIQPKVSRHLRVLADAGIVEARKDAQRRIYGLRSEPFKEITMWLDTFAHIWADRLDALDEHLAVLESQGATTPETDARTDAEETRDER
ncbi:ArsR/SmtB family transcription factor [Plantactinospora sp. GCM10030261]|uniref:ArsR/SmtB family transcription factor n=1 Tax=Plantactinospora sp. GCM10030261 TaxID=3273420 RepID=UPI0036223463